MSRRKEPNVLKSRTFLRISTSVKQFVCLKIIKLNGLLLHGATLQNGGISILLVNHFSRSTYTSYEEKHKQKCVGMTRKNMRGKTVCSTIPPRAPPHKCVEVIPALFTEGHRIAVNCRRESKRDRFTTTDIYNRKLSRDEYIGQYYERREWISSTFKRLYLSARGKVGAFCTTRNSPRSKTRLRNYVKVCVESSDLDDEYWSRRVRPAKYCVVLKIPRIAF